MISYSQLDLIYKFYPQKFETLEGCCSIIVELTVQLSTVKVLLTDL